MVDDNTACSFCGKHHSKVKKMIRSEITGDHICNECITGFKPAMDTSEGGVIPLESLYQPAIG